MSTKAATVSARIQPEIKAQAEAVLAKLGVPVSVLIDTLYRQIIMTNGIPYSLTVPTIPPLEDMTEEEFDEMLRASQEDEENGNVYDLDEAFEIIRKSI